MATKDLFGILFFCVVLRMASTIFIAETFPEGAYFFSLILTAGFEILLVLLCVWLVKIDAFQIKTIIGNGIGLDKVVMAMAIGVALLMFTIGENALEALALSQADQQLAYKLWNFHATEKEVHPFLSWKVLGFLVVACGITPFCEEVFFRGFVLHALVKKRAIRLSVVINSLVFTALHFSHEYYIATFVFSLVLCWSYLWTGSIWFCAVIHSSYNFFAFVSKYSLNRYFIKAPGDMSMVTTWIPEILAFIIASTFLLFLFLKFRFHRVK